MTQAMPTAEFDRYPHCAAVSAVTRRFLAIPVSSAASGCLFWRLVGNLLLFEKVLAYAKSSSVKMTNKNS